MRSPVLKRALAVLNKHGGHKRVTVQELSAVLPPNRPAPNIIYVLRNQYGAEIESIRNGHAIEAYRLVKMPEMKTEMKDVA